MGFFRVNNIEPWILDRLSEMNMDKNNTTNKTKRL